MKNVLCVAGYAACMAAGMFAVPAQGGGRACNVPPQAVVDMALPSYKLRLGDKSSAYDELKRRNVKTIIRYYDAARETLPCKTLLPDEAQEILAKEFEIAVIFQSGNNNPRTFIMGKGEEHARRALELAEANGSRLTPPFISARMALMIR